MVQTPKCFSLSIGNGEKMYSLHGIYTAYRHTHCLVQRKVKEHQPSKTFWHFELRVKIFLSMYLIIFWFCLEGLSITIDENWTYTQSMNAEMQCLSNSDFMLCLVKIQSSTLYLIIKKEKRNCMPKISLILAKYPVDPNTTSLS